MNTQQPSKNVTLLISNQSFDLNPVDIKIWIDGKIVVQDTFDVQGSQLPQHNWKTHHLSLAEGQHKLLIVSDKGKAELEMMFPVKGQQSMMIAYWNTGPSAHRSGGYFTVENRPGPAAVM